MAPVTRWASAMFTVVFVASSGLWWPVSWIDSVAVISFRSSDSVQIFPALAVKVVGLLYGNFS